MFNIIYLAVVVSRTLHRHPISTPIAGPPVKSLWVRIRLCSAYLCHIVLYGKSSKKLPEETI